MEESSRCCKVCVTGGAGFIGSSLIKKLLQKGVYYVHATLRNLGDTTKVDLLKGIPGAETRLQLFEADIYNPQQFEAAIKDCQFVFHVATPMMHTQHSQFKDTTEAAVAGAKSIIESCRKSGTVKRLIYTATVTAASPLLEDGSSFKDYMDENCWTPCHLPIVTSCIHKDYVTSKTESEKAILRFGDGSSSFEVVTLACGLVGGETILSYAPPSTLVSISQLIGSEFYYESLKVLEDLLGKIPVIHVEDTCEAHIFCIEKDSLQGRFLCAADYVSAAEIGAYLQLAYPEFQMKHEYLNGPKRNIKWASTKLIDQGFKYKYGMKMILDDCVKCAKRLGELP